MNIPAMATASSISPPPLKRMSIMMPSTCSFFNLTTSRATTDAIVTKEMKYSFPDHIVCSSDVSMQLEICVWVPTSWNEMARLNLFHYLESLS